MKSLESCIPARLWALAVGGVLLCSLGMTNFQAQTSGNENPGTGSANPPTQPEAKITATETKLIFRTPTTDAQQRTFSVESNPLPKIIVVTHDLLDAETGVVLLSSNIKVTSTRDEAAKREIFNVSISGATRAGHYLGDLELVRADKSPAEKLLTIPLDVTLRGAPAVEADVNSKSLTVKLSQSLLDLPWLGQPSALVDATDGKAGAREYDLYVVQSGEQQATLQSAEILGMRATAGNDLPPGVVRVGTTLPFNIGGHGTAALKVIAAGSNLAPGEYNGTLQINVADQIAPVKIPVKALIKDGPFLALGVLVGGLLAASLFGRWNSKGKSIRDLVKPIQQLEADINAKNLQVEERAQAILILKKTMESLESGESAEEVKKKFDSAQAYVAAARKAVQDFVAEKLDPLLNKTKGITPGKTIRERFIKNLDEIRQNMLAGKYQRLDDARNLIGDPLKGYEKQVAVFESVAKKFSEVAADKQQETATKMDNATTLTELRQALTDVGVTPPHFEPGLAFAADQTGTLAKTAPKRLDLSVRRKLQLSLGAAAVAIIAFLFVLAVGWISIYLKSDTFGANPMDYITLFLWGVTAEAVRGQTISLTNLKTTVKEKAATS